MTQPVQHYLCLSGSPLCSGVAPCDLCLQALRQFMIAPATAAAFGLVAPLHERLASAIDVMVGGVADDEGLSSAARQEVAAIDAQLDALAKLPAEQAALFLKRWEEGRAEIHRRLRGAIDAHAQQAQQQAQQQQATVEGSPPAANTTETAAPVPVAPGASAEVPAASSVPTPEAAPAAPVAGVVDARTSATTTRRGGGARRNPPNGTQAPGDVPENHNAAEDTKKEA